MDTGIPIYTTLSGGGNSRVTIGYLIVYRWIGACWPRVYIDMGCPVGPRNIIVHELLNILSIWMGLSAAILHGIIIIIL